MATIDLTSPRPVPSGLLDGLPRRISLTRPELEFAAHLAGQAPLPFEMRGPPSVSSLTDRLGTPDPTHGSALDTALGSLHAPVESLSRRGLLVDEALDAGISGAVGLLAKPVLALDIDITIDDTSGRSWQRAAGGAVATLSTVDGLVFELCWFGVEHWGAELARVSVLPSDTPGKSGRVPDGLEAAYALIDAAAEAINSGRADLLTTLVAHADEPATAQGIELSPADTVEALTALCSETHGRLRVLASDVSGESLAAIGVLSWVLLNDGWYSLSTRQSTTGRCLISHADPVDLPQQLAPLLAEVTR